MSRPKARGSVTLASLEQEFAWLCSRACNIMVQATQQQQHQQNQRAGRPRTANERDCTQLIQRHAALLQKGLNLDHVPNVAELQRASFPRLRQCARLQFLADFIGASGAERGCPGALLARALVAQPYVDVTKCRVELDPPSAQPPVLFVGQPMQLRFLPLTQYEEACPHRADLQVELLIRRGATEFSPAKGGELGSARILRSLTVFKDMFTLSAPGTGAGAANNECSREESERNEFYERLRKLQTVSFLPDTSSTS